MAVVARRKLKYDATKALGPQVNYTITGIDAGAGAMGNTQTALEKYGLTQKLRVANKFNSCYD